MTDLFTDIMAHQESDKGEPSRKSCNNDDLGGTSVDDANPTASTSKGGGVKY